MILEKPAMPALASANEPADARHIREAYLDGFASLNIAQEFYMNYLVRATIVAIRAEILETRELTRARSALSAKLHHASEPLDHRMLHALALRDVSRDRRRLEDLLRSQSWGSRETKRCLKLVAEAADPPSPPAVSQAA